MDERAIIHLNVADFAVAVERVREPALRDRPIIIVPPGTSRAVVYDMSEEAYRGGVRKGMALARACRLVRDGMVLPPHPERYEQAMRDFFRQALPYTPLIEAGEGNGHLFLDVTGTGRLWGPPPDVAWSLRKAVRSALGFDPIWSVATNKLVAKVATRLVKPQGEYIVEAGDEEAFLRPLPLTLLPGLERESLLLLAELGLRRVVEAAALTLEQLQVVLGHIAHEIYELVRGVDSSPVLPAGQRPPRVGGEVGFAEDTNDPTVVERALYTLVEQVGHQLRQRRLAARRLGLTLGYSDGVRVIRQATATRATANDVRLFVLATAALQRAWTRRVRIRYLRLVGDRLVFPPAQLALFTEDQAQDHREEQLVGVLDRIRQRFGHEAICLGRMLAPGQEGKALAGGGVTDVSAPRAA